MKSFIADLKNYSGKERSESGFYSYMAATATVLMLPIHPQYVPPFMVLWGISWVYEHYRDIKGTWIASPLNIRFLFAGFILYYSFQLIGLLYSTDIKMGLANSFGRLSLILFPLVLFEPGKLIKKRIQSLLKIFTVGTIAFLVFCFINATFRSVSFVNGSIVFNPHPPVYDYLSYFYASDLVIFQHPSYFSIYVILSSFIALDEFFDGSIAIKSRIIWLTMAIFLIISLYFLSSRTALIVEIFILPVYFFKKLNGLKAKRGIFISIIIILILSLPLLLKNQRVEYLYEQITDHGSNVEEPRLIIWKSAAELIKENPVFGVGIGDVRMELAKKYMSLGDKEMAYNRLNAHNQYIEVLLENGIFGFILFMTILLMMIRLAITDKNLLYGIFLFTIMTFFMFETILYRLAGVSFFSLFSFLLYWNIPTTRHKTKLVN